VAVEGADRGFAPKARLIRFRTPQVNEARAIGSGVSSAGCELFDQELASAFDPLRTSQEVCSRQGLRPLSTRPHGGLGRDQVEQ
jgi:hypothetical protein